jgi:hypothetical protein
MNNHGQLITRMAEALQSLSLEMLGAARRDGAPMSRHASSTSTIAFARTRVALTHMPRASFTPPSIARPLIWKKPAE